MTTAKNTPTKRVPLPVGYVDDAQHRAKLYLALAARGCGWQVESVRPGDNGISHALLRRGTPSTRPEARDEPLGPSATERSAADLDAQLRAEGLTLLDYQWTRRNAVIGCLAPHELRLRHQIAQYLGCADWDVDVATEWSTDGREAFVSSVIIDRYPLITDPLARQRRWQGLIDEICPIAPNASWRIVEDTANMRLRLTREGDPLAEMITLADFEDQYRAKHEDPWTSWGRFPVAIRESREPVDYTTFHTVVIGQTGAGKGSALWGILSGMLPAARAGLVEFFAIDPKNAECKVGENENGRPNAIFERVATTPDDWDLLLEDMVADMKARQAKSGRSFKISEERPLRIVLIDELSALSTFDSDRQRAARVESNLLLLLSQGRSDGFIVIAAVQAPQKDMVGRLRNFFAMRVALRTETAIETDLVLGNGSVDQGALAHLIEPANPGNGYRTAGIGYMRVEGEARPVRVRFPYTTDEDLEAWSNEWAERRATPAAEIVAAFEFDLDQLDPSLIEDGQAEVSAQLADPPTTSAAPPTVHDDGWGD